MRQVFCSLLLCAATAGAGAQIAPTAAACERAAARVVGRPLPALDDSTFLVWHLLATCGTSGNAAAARALRSSALLTETDTLRAGEFFKLFYARRAPDLFSALQFAIRSAESAPFVRMRSVQALGALHSPTFDFYETYFTQPSPGYCGYRPTSVSPTGSVSDLPPNYLSQIVETMRAAENDVSNPVVVRGAAHCWWVTLERLLPADVSKVKLKHVCETRFRVENSNPAPVRLTADVEGTTETHSFVVSGESGFLFSTSRRGHVRLFMDGVLIDKKETASNKCK